MTLRFALLALVALLAAPPALADDAYDKCMDDSDGSNPAWAACGDELIRREDAKLNATWKRVFAETGDETKKDLLAEQRAWNAFKERSCKFYVNGEWGREGSVVHFMLCRAAVIAARTQALEYYGSFFKP
jgi:uncharacterized protein YecT (DUF1311 family)